MALLFRAIAIAIATVNLSLFSPSAAIAQSRTISRPISFAFVSDVHLCDGVPDNSLKLTKESQVILQDIVKQINAMHLDFVVFGGDMVESPGKNDKNWQFFADVVQGLNCPWYFVLGESDVTGPPAVDRMRTYGVDFKGKGIDTTTTYWSHDPIEGEPLHLIGLDTARANSNTGDVKRDQLAWLRSDLEKNRGKYTVVLSHHPLLAPSPYDGGPPFEEYSCMSGASVREVLGSFNDVKLSVNGHVPVNKVQREGTPWYVSASCAVIYPCQFKVIRLHPQAIEVSTHQISYPAFVKMAGQIMESSRLAYLYSSSKPRAFLDIVEGSDIDQAAILPLAPGEVAHKAGKQKKVKQPKEKPLKEKKQKEIKAKEKETKESKTRETKKTEQKIEPKEEIKEEQKESGKTGLELNPDLTPAPEKSDTPDMEKTD